jgi:hypothetical protein
LHKKGAASNGAVTGMVSVADTSLLTVRLLLAFSNPLELRSPLEANLRQSLQGIVLRIELDIRKLRTLMQMINGSGMSRAETTAGTTSTGRSNMDDFRAASVVVMSFTLREAVHSGLGLADSSSVLPNRITRSAMIGSGIAIRS